MASRDMFLDALTIAPARSVAPVPAAAPPVNRNRFAGACHICGRAIAAGEGSLVKLSGNWKVQCVDATQCAYANAPAPVDAPVVIPEKPAPVAVSNQAALDRPDFAAEIDAMVADMVARGDVVLDLATDTYRMPHARRFRFGYSE